MRATIDTNIFVYLLDAREPIKRAVACELVPALQAMDCFVGLQCVGETYWALVRRLKRAPWEAAQAARDVLAAFPTFGPSESSVERALSEAMAGRFSYWDALLLASAHEAGCNYCFSEDMADGAKLGAVEIINPFCASGLSERAAEVLGGGT